LASLSIVFVILGALSVPSTVDADPADIVLYAAEAAVVKGHWRATASASAAGGRSLATTDQGWASLDVPLPAPANYFEMTFDAPSATTYRVWLRLRASGNSKWNDAVWLQFSDALLSNGSAAYRMGTTAGLLVNLERCSGCGVSNWGWQNKAWWLSQPTTVTFASTGRHTIRVQTREDGVEVDQIVLSPAKYISAAPGQPLNDAVIVPRVSSPPSSSLSPYGGTPAPVPGTIDATRFDNGGANVAYYDTTVGNTGGAFRSTHVDLQPASGGGYNVGWTTPGEWLKYTVAVASTGYYTAQVAVASIGGGKLQIEVGAATTSVTVPNTGDWQKWTTLAVPVSLSAGRQVMTVRFMTSGINLRSVALTSASAPPPPSTGQTLVVNAGGDLQAAINIAQPGDTVLLQAGATFVGNFVLKAKSGSSTNYITIRSSAPDSSLPGSNVRITPAYAAQLPKLRSPNTAAALRTEPYAHHYRLMFLELKANANGAGDIVRLGSSEQNTLGSVPHHLILDRLYIRGDANVGQKRGVALNSAHTDVLNSHISDIKSASQDSQAIGGWNGPGPFNIVNNYLEGAGENVMFGGADPKIPNLVPSDIVMRRNHFSKPLTWRSQHWIVKNLLELKNAQRVVVEGNLFENNWLAAQSGYAILLKSVNQDGTAPWSVVQDVKFINNVIRHVSSAFNILGRETNTATIEANNITIRNNLVYDVSAAKYGGSGRFLITNGGSSLTIDHNTVFNDGAPTVAPDVSATAGFAFTNNVIMDNGAAIKGSGVGVGTVTIAKYYPGAQVFGNIFVGSPAASYPAANFYPRTIGDVGFTNLSGGNYRLGSTSIYRNGATDGTDPGCDLDALNKATGASF
jgi:hypothetical protein